MMIYNPFQFNPKLKSKTFDCSVSVPYAPEITQKLIANENDGGARLLPLTRLQSISVWAETSKSFSNFVSVDIWRATKRRALYVLCRAVVRLMMVSQYTTTPLQN